MSTVDIFSGDIHSINGLARSYSALDYAQKLRLLLKTVYPSLDLVSCSKKELHQIINDTLLKRYSGEEIIKYRLVKEFFKRNVTAAFELKVNNSRVDFLTINGETKSFEIKSGLDNLQKLEKQVNDYIKVFEYNHIVLDEKHLSRALNIIPETYGIWVFKGAKKKIVRNAFLNKGLDPILQLNIFNKKELSLFFAGLEDRERIADLHTAEEINSLFKQMLKMRYEKKWNFIKKNKDEILPVDFHFFYHNNISPNLIYGIS